VADLMDESPQTVDESELDPVIAKVKEELSGAGWVESSAVRLREHGHRITGEAWVVPASNEDVTERLAELGDRIHDLDWRLHGVAVVAVEALDEVPEDLLAGKRDG
jgi:hypothetical protein